MDEEVQWMAAAACLLQTVAMIMMVIITIAVTSPEDIPKTYVVK